MSLDIDDKKKTNLMGLVITAVAILQGGDLYLSSQQPKDPDILLQEIQDLRAEVSELNTTVRVTLAEHELRINNLERQSE